MACRSCRSQKRKCNGKEPCSNCVRYNYDCEYRRTSAVGPRHPLRTGDSGAASGYATPIETPRSADISAVASPSSDRATIDSLAWNLGVRNPLIADGDLVTRYIPKSEMKVFAGEYFSQFHPFYPFLKPERFYKSLDERWTRPLQLDPLDGLLCGVAAIGCLFVNAPEQGSSMVKCAEHFLQSSLSISKPGLDHIGAWILRVFYLRITSTPHVCWLASCTLMHLAEATSLHLDTSEARNSPLDHALWDDDAEYRRRLFHFATLLNKLASYELGRDCVKIRNTTAKQPKTHYEEEFKESMRMSQLFDLMDPHGHPSLSTLEGGIMELQAYRPRAPPLILIQTYVIFCIYRQLRNRSSMVPDTLTNFIIEAGRRGLETALALICAGQPWWHAATVPVRFRKVFHSLQSRRSADNVWYVLIIPQFRYIGILLAIGSRAATIEIGPAIRAIKLIESKFPSEHTHSAVRRITALAVQVLGQKREETSMLADLLENITADQGTDTLSAGSKDQPLNELDDTVLFDFDFGDLDNQDWNFSLFPEMVNSDAT